MTSQLVSRSSTFSLPHKCLKFYLNQWIYTMILSMKCISKMLRISSISRIYGSFQQTKKDLAAIFCTPATMQQLLRILYRNQLLRGSISSQIFGGELNVVEKSYGEELFHTEVINMCFTKCFLYFQSRFFLQNILKFSLVGHCVSYILPRTPNGKNFYISQRLYNS